MCNYIHKPPVLRAGKEPKPLEKTEGVGWKIIKGKNMPLTHGPTKTFEVNTEGEIEWNPKFQGDGFCFFLTWKEAREALRLWRIHAAPTSSNKLSVRKISYSQGLVEQDEYNFITSFIFRIALCKKFTIIPLPLIRKKEKWEKDKDQ